MIKIIDALVQSACQGAGVEVNGEKYGCGWRATKRADGWQEEGCRNAHPSDTRSQMKPSDKKAEAITFGVELETPIPVLSGVVVGNYHNGISVRAGVATGSTAPLNAPTFNGECWRAERDGSIRARADRTACEFVSPILSKAVRFRVSEVEAAINRMAQNSSTPNHPTSS
jgi:nitrate reductase NapE component